MAAQVSVQEIVKGRVDLDDLQVGADVVEMAVDLVEGTPATSHLLPHEAVVLEIAEAFAILRRVSIVPIVLTVDRRIGSASPDLYCALTSYCLRLGPEYCSVDLSLQDSRKPALLTSRGRTLVIGILDKDHAPATGWQDTACMHAYRRADSLGCSVVKLMMPAHDMDSNLAISGFLEQAKQLQLKARLTAYNTGVRGKTSLCYNRIMTPVSPAPSASTTPRSDNERLVTSKDIFSALFATFVYEPLHFFIYGANVSYSLSPAMHNAAYRALGMPHVLGKHSSDTLDHFERLVREHEFGGAAVVQPYKTGVLPLMNGLSSHASVIGSVNTILPVRELGPDGSLPDQLGLLSQMNRSGSVKALYGDNTDWIGIRACLRNGLSPANTVRPQSTALVCGAGGQGRSAVYALLSLGVQHIFICNRTLENARAVAEHYNELIDSNGISILRAMDATQCRVRVLGSFASPWPKEYRQPSMIVSSIPTQAADGSPTNFQLPDTWLGSPTGGILIELAYRPMVTPIVKQMRAQSHRGWIMMDGFDVLPEQAFAQFELFTGRRAPRKIMRDEVLKKYREEQQHLDEARNMDPNPPAT